MNGTRIRWLMVLVAALVAVAAPWTMLAAPAPRYLSPHKGPLCTDQKLHNVGTVGKFDSPTNRFDTSSLIEVWRTAPYLHDGRAATVRDVMTTCNPDDRHGRTSGLTRAQIDELAAFVLSL